jgi:hypothetical protein
MTSILTKACPYVYLTGAIYKSIDAYSNHVDVDVLLPLSTSVKRST